MASLWRRFQFFDKELVTEDGKEEGKGDGKDNDKDSPMAIFTDFTPTCSTSGRGCLVFGDEKGNIRIINRDFEAPKKFQAHAEAIIDIHQVPASSSALTLPRLALHSWPC